jgi:hypothetical protein
MAQVNSGQVAITLIIEHKKIVQIVDPVNTTILDCPDQEREQYEKSAYGLKTVETIFETDTQSPNTCFLVIGRKKVPIPCG